MHAKLEAYLRIGGALCDRTASLAAAATAGFKVSAYKATLRNDVLIALVLKMDSAFRCAMDDARVERAEAMHHLKTMIESFIYFYSVAKDQSDRAAELVLAEAASEHELFYRENPDLDTGGDQAFWKSIQDDFAGEEAQQWLSVKGRANAHSPELGKWYQAVYREACQPAHIADLFGLLPNADEPLIQVARTFPGTAQRAIDHGLTVMFDLCRVVNQGNEIGVLIEVSDLEAEYRRIRQEPEAKQ